MEVNMKLIILLSALALSHSATLDRVYLPPGNTNSDGANFLDTPKLSENHGIKRLFGSASNGNDFAFTNNGQQLSNKAYEVDTNFLNSDDRRQFGNINEQRPKRPQTAFERNAATLREENETSGDAFSYLFETENGIFVEESGIAINGVQAQGGYSYTGDDGQVYSITYTADENGFIPHGDHLPTAPPVPEEILRALEQNANDEAAGIFDDGSYSEHKYGSGDLDQSQRTSNAIFDNNGIDNSNDNGAQLTEYFPPNQNRLSGINLDSSRIPFTVNGPNRINPTSTNINDVQQTHKIANSSTHTTEIKPEDFTPKVGNTMNFENSQSATHSLPKLGSSETEPRVRQHKTPFDIDHDKRPTSYDVPISSSIEEDTPSDNGFGRRVNFSRKPDRPSFNSRTGYNY